MANSDGSLKFDTQLDNSGFEKGADKIQRNLDSIKASAEQVNAASSRAAQAVAGQFQHMASDAPEAASAMLGLNDAMKNIADGMGTSAGRSAAQMQSAAQQTAQAAQTLKSYLPDTFTSADFDKTLVGTGKAVTSLESQMGRLGDSIRRGFSTDAQVGKFDADIEKASGSVADLKAKLIALGKSQISTTEYDGLTKSISQAEQALFKLYDRRDVMEQLGTDKTSREWQRLAIQIENAEAELAQFERQKAYLESSGGAYTSGTDSAEWLRQAQAVKDATAQIQAYKSAAAQATFDRQLNATGDAAAKLDKQIETLTQRLQSGLKTPAQISSFQQKFNDAESAAASLQDRLKALAQQLQAVEGSDSGTATQAAAGFNTQAEAVQHLIDKLNTLRQSAVSAGAIASDANSAGSAVGNLAEKTAKAGGHASTAKQFFSEFANQLKRTAQTALSAAKNLLKMGWKAISNGMKNAVKNLASFNSQSKSTNVSVQGLIRQLTSLKTLLISRIKRMFISQIFNGVGDAINSLAKFSTAFDKSMSNIKNSMTGLSANIAVGLGGLISAIEPVLTRIISAISTAMTYLNALFAMLRGKSTITVAKKQTGSYAASLDKAAGSAKELNEQVYGFDELNKRQKQTDSSGGGGGSGGGDLFEEKPIDDILPKAVKDYFDRLKAAIAAGDWYGVGKIIAEGLNTAFEAVDNWINNTLRPQGVKWARNIAQIFNGIVDGLNWELVGKTVGDGLNAIADTINTFLTTFNFYNLGRGIGRAITSLFDTVDWNLLGQTFANRWNALINFIWGLVTTPGIWVKMGKSISEFINSAFATIRLDTAARALAATLNGLFSTIQTLADNIQWGAIAKKIYTSLNIAFRGIHWADCGKALSDFVIHLLDTLLEVASKTDWQALGRGIGELIGSIDWVGAFARLAVIIGDALGGVLEGLFSTTSGKVIAGLFVLYNGIKAFLAVKAADLALSAAKWVASVILPISSMGTATAAAGAATEASITTVSGLISAKFTSLIAMVGQKIVALLSFLGPTGVLAVGLIALGAVIALNYDSIYQTMYDFGGKVYDVVHGTWENVKQAVGDAVTNAKDAVSAGWQLVSSETSREWGVVKQTVSTTWQNVKTNTSAAVSSVRSNVGQAWATLKSNTMATYSSIQTTASQKFNSMRASVTATANGIKTAVASTWQNIQSTASSKWQSITSTVTGKWNALKSILKASDWTSIGTNLVQGLKSGIENAWHALTSKVQSLAQNLTNTMKNAVGVHSPSVVWAEIGHYLDVGLQNGITNSQNKPLSAVDALAESVTAGMDFSKLNYNIPQMDAITNMIASAGQLAIPDIAAGTVIPAKCKVTDAPASGGIGMSSDDLLQRFSDIDERQSETNDLLRKLREAIIKYSNVYIDIDDLTRMITRRQKMERICFGGD
ncbi:hypothetical protein [Gemmiger sp.]